MPVDIHIIYDRRAVPEEMLGLVQPVLELEVVANLSLLPALRQHGLINGSQPAHIENPIVARCWATLASRLATCFERAGMGDA